MEYMNWQIWILYRRDWNTWSCTSSPSKNWQILTLQIYINIYIYVYIPTLTRSSAVGIAIRCGLDGPGIEFPWGEIFRARPARPWGLLSPLYCKYRVIPGDKAAGGGVNHPPSFRAEFKERVELYLYSSLCAFMAYCKENFTLHTHIHTRSRFCWVSRDCDQPFLMDLSE